MKFSGQFPFLNMYSQGSLHNRSSKGQVQGFHFVVVLNLYNGFTLYIHSIETPVEERALGGGRKFQKESPKGPKRFQEVAWVEFFFTYKFLSLVIVTLEFLEFLAELVYSLDKFLLKFFSEIIAPFTLFSNFRESLVTWEVPQFTPPDVPRCSIGPQPSQCCN